MNKLTFIGSAAFLLAGLSACTNELDQPAVSGPGNVHFNVELPAGISTRAFADGTTASNLTYAVYQGGTLVSQGKAVIADKTARVDMDLATGGTYDVVFWADADGSPYTFSAEDRKVSVDYSLMTGNNDNGDAFFCIENDIKVEGPVSKTVTLTRPAAQLNIGTSDITNPSVLQTYPNGVYTSVEVEAYTNLNLADGTVSDPVTVRIPAALPPAETEAFPVAGNYRYLSMVYLMVPDDSFVSDLTLSYTADATSATGQKLTVPNTPLKRNYRTNIYGALLTSATDWNITVDPEFGGNADTVSV